MRAEEEPGGSGGYLFKVFFGEGEGLFRFVFLRNHQT